MALFGSPKPKQERKTAGKPDGEQFLRAAKQQLANVFSDYIENEGTFNSVQDFSNALFEDVWINAEQLLKKNFYNGLRIGQAGRRGSKKK